MYLDSYQDTWSSIATVLSKFYPGKAKNEKLLLSNEKSRTGDIFKVDNIRVDKPEVDNSG
jgi:hypothetical protein